MGGYRCFEIVCEGFVDDGARVCREHSDAVFNGAAHGRRRTQDGYGMQAVINDHLGSSTDTCEQSSKVANCFRLRYVDDRHGDDDIESAYRVTIAFANQKLRPEGLSGV
jgi:hypothetical protein